MEKFMSWIKAHLVIVLVIAGVIVVGVTSTVLAVVLYQPKYNFNNTLIEEYGANYISPSNIDVEGDFGYVSDETAKKVYKIDLKSKVVVKTYQAEDAVNGVYVSGNDVFALVGGLQGYVIKLNKDLGLVSKIETKHTPVEALVAGDKLYVANRFASIVSIYNTADLKLISELDMSREPMAMVKQGNFIYVACHLPQGDATADVVSANVVVINTQTNKVEKTISLLNGTSSVKDICVSNDGAYIYLTNVFARYTYPTSMLDRGWINTNGITIISTATNSVVTGVLLDNENQGAANPWGIDMTEDDKIIVSLSGLSEIVIIDEAEMLARIDSVKEGNGLVETVAEIPDYLNFLNGAKERVKINGDGARYLEVVGNDVYITKYFDGTVEKLTLEKDEHGCYPLEKISLGTQVKVDQARRGQVLWYDATKCFQEWESCASCHPDARVDAFNWDNLNDGLGNSKAAKSMLYSHRTPPSMITGARETAELAVRKGMQFIQFNTLEEPELVCIDEYLKTLKPTESPYLERDGKLTKSAKRGEKLFDDLNCASCHTGPNFTDMQKHDSKALKEEDVWDNIRTLDTPTLVEVWRSGPWLFNGKASTMEEAIKYQKGTEKLKANQLTDLANYVLSIGDSGEHYGVEQVFFDNLVNKDLAVNILKPGTKMYKVTVRKQSDITTDAVVKIQLFNKNKQIGKTAYGELTGMKKGQLAKIDVSLEVPNNLAKGSYYKIQIVSRKDANKKLASEFKVMY